MLQRHAVEKFHDQEGMGVLLADFVDGADIGMVEGGCGLRLALKAGKCLGVFDDVVGKKLQGDETMEGDVLSLVNHAHSAATELLDDAVVRDGLADHYKVWGFG